jgi:hypothetical protein
MLLGGTTTLVYVEPRRIPLVTGSDGFPAWLVINEKSLVVARDLGKNFRTKIGDLSDKDCRLQMLLSK